MLSTEILKSLVTPVILGAFIFGFICTGMASHTSVHGGKNAVMMTLMGQQEACCNTTISKNVELWKGTLLVLPHGMRDSFILLALSFVVTFAFSRLPFQSSQDSILASYRYYERNKPDIPTFNHLKLAFARGILNPKIY